MTSDVSLTAALKNNILSLKSADKNNAERVKDSAAGLLQAQEVGEAAPQQAQDSVFAATTLNSRASDLTRLLDGLSDSIQTIKSADQGLSDIAELLSEATSVLQNIAENGETEALVKQYNDTLERIDTAATGSEAGFRGTNLLNGDDLASFFNEDKSSSLITQGRILAPKALGLSQLDYPGAAIENAFSEIRSAKDEVQSFDSTLANDLSVIQTRRDFTQNLIGTLTEGANKISVTGQSAEGATLLALNTKQQLEGSNISLASQSQESILRFF
jgi:flagellin